MEFDRFQFSEFLFQVRPIMELLGIQIVLPKSLKNIIRPKPSVQIKGNSEGNPSGILGLDRLLDFDWRVSLGKNLVSPQEFKALVSKAGGLTKYKGSYIFIDGDDLLRLEKFFRNETALSNIEVLQIALSQNYEGASIKMTEDALSIIRELTEFDTIELPIKTKATLRPYQIRGYSWLVKNAKVGVGSILADDMGLGKTLQIITFLCYLYEKNTSANTKTIIVVPTSLIPNWEAEFLKFAPHLDIFTYYGPQRKFTEIAQQSIIITSYGTARSDGNKLKKIKWDVCVIDESQNIKNPKAQQTKTIKKLSAKYNIAMSGTPVENRLMDYWSVMDFVNKGLLGTMSYFTKTFAKPIANENNRIALENFINITSPFILRRMKTDKSIINDLPDKIVKDTYAFLSPEQAALYQKILNEAMQMIENVEMDDNHALFKRQGLVLQMILSLKQVCNHPAQWLKNNIILPELSGKLLLLLDTIRAILDNGEKLLIFTQFREMGDIIEKTISNEIQIPILWLHGQVSMKKRKEMVENFQQKPHQKIMILSLKAGGTGLNLTAASHVIHYDLWWNPAVEAQATDRAFRIGQKRNVMVHRFITQNTFEEKINALINSKKKLADMTVTTGEKWIGNLSNNEIQELFALSE